MMNRYFAVLLTAVFSLHAAAASIEGKWRTIDDKTNKEKAVVSIVRSGNTFNGKIVALANGVENVCPACKDKKPLLGLTVLTGLKESGGKYENGEIFDPKSGKTYSAKAELSADGKQLKVRGYLGVSLLGRTQTWYRVN